MPNDDILEDSFQQIPIIEIVSYGLIDALREILQKRVDVNEQDGFGNCAVLAAASRNDLAMLTLLVEAKANLEVKDRVGRSPLGWAKKHQNQGMIELIEGWFMAESIRADRDPKV